VVLPVVTAAAQEIHVAFGAFGAEQVLLLPPDLLQQAGVVLPKST